VAAVCRQFGWVVEFKNRSNPDREASFPYGSLVIQSRGAAVRATKAMLASSPKSHKLKVLLQIMYLRTYRNAGTAEVRLDGKRVAVLDALHPNFVRFPYSIEELLTLQLEVQQVPSKVEILWRFDNYSSLPGRGACATEDTEWRRKGKDVPLPACMIRQARGPTQKVKISSVMLCVAAT